MRFAAISVAHLYQYQYLSEQRSNTQRMRRHQQMDNGTLSIRQLLVLARIQTHRGSLALHHGRKSGLLAVAQRLYMLNFVFSSAVVDCKEIGVARRGLL